MQLNKGIIYMNIFLKLLHKIRIETGQWDSLVIT